MIRKLLFWLCGHLPCRLINDGDRPYLERYYVGRAERTDGTIRNGMDWLEKVAIENWNKRLNARLSGGPV